MRRLKTHVHITDEHGAPHVFGPDDDVPGWAAKKIRNPHVWADDGGREQQAAATRTGEQTGGETGEQTGGTDVPPMSGRGSGREAWAVYAAAHDVDVPEGATREDIVQALEGAGVPTQREG